MSHHIMIRGVGPVSFSPDRWLTAADAVVIVTGRAIMTLQDMPDSVRIA